MRRWIPISLLLLAACGGRAATYFVSSSGLDANPGTLAQPWRTIQKAANAVAPGDTVNIRAGTYSERVSLSGKRATAALPIVFQTHPGDATAAVDQGGVTPPNGNSALLHIHNCDHVTVRNLEFRNYKTASATKTPIGILVDGDGSGVKLIGCKVHDIWQSNTTLNNFNANAFGILVLGDALSPIDGFVLGDCEVHTLRTGASESVALNGNVTNFTVTNNLVHDCNNIGIDFIGFEGMAPTEALDQARGGLCAGNTIWNVDSKFNPAYGGNFGAGGSDDTRAAPGLYVDGGRDIVMERNHVYACNFGVSLGSEHFGKATSGVTLRNNVLHHCHVGGIVLGGSDDTENGGVQNCVVEHNTLYLNDTAGYGGGQVSLQNYVTGTVIRHNIMVCNASTAQFVLKTNTNGFFALNAIDWNLYSGAAQTAVEFIWNNTMRSTFAAWKSASAQDAHSFFVASPRLAGAALTSASPVADYYLGADSAAIHAGDPAFAPAAGVKDHSGQSRLAGGRVDIGADEYLTGWQAWRDQFFGLPDGGPNAQPGDDPEGDRVVNLVEYAVGGSPFTPDRERLPTLVRMGATFRFRYRKEGAGLTYTVEQTATLPGGWSPVTASEQTDGFGQFWRDFTAPAPLFVRLNVTLP